MWETKISNWENNAYSQAITPPKFGFIFDLNLFAFKFKLYAQNLFQLKLFKSIQY